MTEQPNKNGINTGKDPETGRFLPGNPGGPGAPKGSKHITTLFLNALKSRKDNKSGKSYEDLFIDRILTETIIKGKEGMIRHAWDHIDGTPSQKMDLTSDGERIGGTLADQELIIVAEELSKRLKKKKTDIVD